MVEIDRTSGLGWNGLSHYRSYTKGIFSDCICSATHESMRAFCSSEKYLFQSPTFPFLMKSVSPGILSILEPLVIGFDRIWSKLEWATMAETWSGVSSFSRNFAI